MKSSRVIQVLSHLVLMLAGALLFTAAVTFEYHDGDVGSLLLSALLTALIGGGLWLWSRRNHVGGDLTQRESFVVVAVGWALMALVGALPFLFSHSIPAWYDAYFESMSGFTTTGASVLNSPQDLPHGIAFWRCFIQWIGGLGIVLFVLAVLPNTGSGGKYLFRAESTGITEGKFTPRLRDTAKQLWLIYFLLTALEALALKLTGMHGFDAWTHSFATMASGGFSTRNASLGAFGVGSQLVVCVFMYLAGFNFAIFARIVRAYRTRTPMKGMFSRDTEWKTYTTLTLSITLVCWLLLVLQHDRPFWNAGLDSLFQTTSILSTTGFATDDFNLWPPLGKVMMLIAMTVGGMTGSTAGGLKPIRLRVLLEEARVSARKMLHPRMVSVIRVDGQALSREVVEHVNGFSVMYLLLAVAGTLVLTALASSFDVGLSASLACMGNVGPGLGEVGPMGNYAALHPVAKLSLVGLMLLGRLELYTVLVLFSRHFWRK